MKSTRFLKHRYPEKNIAYFIALANMQDDSGHALGEKYANYSPCHTTITVEPEIGPGAHKIF